MNSAQSQAVFFPLSIAGVFNPRAVGQIQPMEPWHLAFGAPHGLRNLAVGEKCQLTPLPFPLPNTQALHSQVRVKPYPYPCMAGLKPGKPSSTMWLGWYWAALHTTLHDTGSSPVNQIQPVDGLDTGLWGKKVEHQ